MDKRQRKILRYVGYSFVLAIVFAFVSPLIARYIPSSEADIFDWQVFTLWLFTMFFMLFLAIYSPKFRKSGRGV